MMKKRIDVLLVNRGLAGTRSKAQALVMAGQVMVDGKRVDKVGTLIDEEAEIKIKETSPYVSRGALKIEEAYKEFSLDFEGKTICDIGASTGGFTDFALQHGAKKVYAIDVGYGQLEQKLRENERVVVMEKTNIKDIESLPGRVDFYVVDVSFISLKKVLPIIKKLGGEEVVVLVKPQFEVGKKIADKNKGIIKDEQIQSEVVEGIARFAEDLGFKVNGLAESPITGAKGNKEFLMWLKC